MLLTLWCILLEANNMASGMLQGNTVPMFQYEPRDTASQRWVVWADRFDNYLIASGIEKPPRQRALLLHMIGEELYSIFKTLKEAEPDVSKNETVYDTAKAALTSFFAP